MKRLHLRILSLLLFIGIFTNSAHAQFGDLLNKASKAAASKGAKALGLDNILKQPDAISTKFADVNRTGEQFPDFHNDQTFTPLTNLPKHADGGYILKAGNYEIF